MSSGCKRRGGIYRVSVANLKRPRRFCALARSPGGSASYSYPPRSHSKQMNHAPKWPTEFRRHVASTHALSLALPYIEPPVLVGTTLVSPKGGLHSPAHARSNRIYGHTGDPRARTLRALSHTHAPKPRFTPTHEHNRRDIHGHRRIDLSAYSIRELMPLVNARRTGFLL